MPDFARALDDLLAAASDPATAKRRGNRFSILGVDAGEPALGWVHPPTLAQVQAALGRMLARKPLAGHSRVLFCGTGGWIHAVEVVRERTAAGVGERQGVLHSLDPAALAVLPISREELERAACIGISASRSTLETRLLVETLQERFAAEALAVDEHFAWLTMIPHAAAAPEPAGAASAFSLTVSGRADVNALFSAPFTLATLLPLHLALGPDGFERVYDTLVASLAPLRARMAAVAYEVSRRPGAPLHVRCEGPPGAALERWLLQLVRQSLGGKSSRGPSDLCVSPDEPPADVAVVDLTEGLSGAPVCRALQAMYAAEVFVACLAYWLDIVFVTHPEVQRYKAQIPALLAAPAEVQASGPEAGAGSLAAVLEEVSRARLRTGPAYRRVEIVLYGRVVLDVREALAARLTHSLGRSCRVYEGSDWNHHSYQAAVGGSQALHVLVDMLPMSVAAPGFAAATLARNARVLRAIAHATHATLGAHAVLVRWPYPLEHASPGA